MDMTYNEIIRRLDALEKRVADHDKKFKKSESDKAPAKVKTSKN